MGRPMALPVYRFSAAWLERVGGQVRHNSTSSKRMFSSAHSKEWMEAFKLIWWKVTSKQIVESERWKTDSILSLKELTVEYVACQTWVLVWFQHERIDTGESDNELLASFGDYVWKVKRRVWNEPLPSWASRYDSVLGGELMGADERWRWKGPCRCDGCKRNGVVRIDH